MTWLYPNMMMMVLAASFSATEKVKSDRADIKIALFDASIAGIEEAIGVVQIMTGIGQERDEVLVQATYLYKVHFRRCRGAQKNYQPCSGMVKTLL